MWNELSGYLVVDILNSPQSDCNDGVRLPMESSHHLYVLLTGRLNDCRFQVYSSLPGFLLDIEIGCFSASQVCGGLKAIVLGTILHFSLFVHSETSIFMPERPSLSSISSLLN